MGVCCVGQACYDIVGATEKDLRPNEKYRIESHFGCGGGPALNAACVCALWGLETHLVARLGPDAFASLTLESLGEYGVATELLIEDSGARTSFSLVVVNPKTGDRTIFNFPAVRGDARARLAPAAPAVILSDGHEAEESLLYRKAFPLAAHVVDAGTCREDTLRVARTADYLVCSRSFASQYLGHEFDDADDALEGELERISRINGRDFVAVTLGEKGVAYRLDGRVLRRDAFRAEAVDTTGAGDIFHGAFSYAVHEGLSIPDALSLGCMASSISVTRMGGQRSIPTLREVREALEGRGIRLPDTGRTAKAQPNGKGTER